MTPPWRARTSALVSTMLPLATFINVPLAPSAFSIDELTIFFVASQPGHDTTKISILFAKSLSVEQ